MTKSDNYTGLEIAVIGMSGRFPEAKNIHELWANLKEGKEMISFFSDEELLEQGIPEELVRDPNYIKAKGVLADAENFDAPFFGYTNKEADFMDPQFRVFHECAYHALEDAGYADPKYRGVTGLFAGAGFNPFWIANFLPSFKNFSEIFEISSLNAREYLTTRVAYKLDLDGPTMTLQTACSTSLVAVHMACQSLLAGEADMALAGGVSILFPSMDLPRKYGMPYQEGMIISKDGHCKPFDKDANGFMGGDGVGVVVLKRLEDAIEQGDNIYAVIKGSAINNDGSAKAGYSAPGTKGQTNVIETALQLANVDPETIKYIETHGSGTKLGDPIELQALHNAYKVQSGNHCGIGSIKSNFGHLDAAAGIAGFIKTVLTLKNEQIPPSINFNDPNPDIDFENSAYYVNTLLQDWHTNGIPRRAAVSSFGIGGTNAHMVMEEAPLIPAKNVDEQEHLILLSAKTKSALLNTCQKLKDYLEANKDIRLHDLAYTLQVGRNTFEYKRAIPCNNLTELIEQLAPEINDKKIIGQKDTESKSMVFVFSGLGGQYVNMGLDLYKNLRVFKELMDEGFVKVEEICDLDLKSIIYPAQSSGIEASDSNSIKQFDNAQLALFVFERAIAKSLISWGIIPVAVMGYSFGELTAAHIAGVMTLEDTIKLIHRRGQMIMDCENGAMLSVPLNRSDLGGLPKNVALAIDNGDSCVISGPTDEIDEFSKNMQAQRHICMKLEAERAIHSDMMEPVFESLRECISEISLSTPSIPMVSNVTGNWVTEDIISAEYWLDHLSKTVEFAKGVETLLTLPGAALTEIGPGADISATLLKFIERDSQHSILNTIKPAASKVPDMRYLMMRLQKIWTKGFDITWDRLYESEKPNRISLPGYSFDKHRYWFKDRQTTADKDRDVDTTVRHEGDELIKNPDHSQWYYLPSWQQSFNMNDAEEFNSISNWLVYSDESEMSQSLIDSLRKRNQEVIVLRKGVSYNRISHSEFVINPLIEGQYQFLLNDLIDDGIFPEKVLQLWSMHSLEIEDLNDNDIDDALACGFYSLTNLARVMHENDLEEAHLDIFAITKEMYGVIGNESIRPVHANILGACRVLPIEFQNINCRQIDIQTDDQNTLTQILKELAIVRQEPVLAMRNGNIWAQSFDNFTPVHKPSEFGRLIDEGNVYVIVGGLCSRSNIGYVLSKHLSDSAPVKIVLLSRTKYPNKTDWDSLGNQNGNRKLSEKISQIRQIENGQGEVYTYSTDITQYEELKSAVEKIEKEVGKINGVINVAGIMDEQSMGLVISNNSQQHFKSQFDIKVKGTINLYRVLKDRKLDFCVLSSSLTSVMGPFAAYCGGNNFMDALVQQLNQSDNKSWLTINWDHLLGFDDKQSDQPLAINHHEIIEVFESILPLNKKVSQVVISSADIKKRINKTLNISPTKNNSSLSTRRPFSKWFYSPDWQKIVLDSSVDQTQGRTLVFMGSSKINDILLKELQKAASSLAIVFHGKKYESSDLHFTIDPSNAEHYTHLFQELKESGFTPTSIYHLWNSTDETRIITEDIVENSQQLGFYSLLNIAKSVNKFPDQSIRINVLTSNMQSVTGQEELCAEKASMLGVIKVLPVEINSLQCTSIDLEGHEIGQYSKSQLKQLANEVIVSASSNSDGHNTIAYRDQQWYTQTLKPVELNKAQTGENLFKQNGTYLLTGGLGGMALRIMEHISRDLQANFIIIDKKSLPPRKDWKKIIESGSGDAHRLKQLQNLERSGSRFVIIEGDISNYSSLHKDVSDAIALFGVVNGAFHIAGGIDHGGIIQTRSLEETAKIMAPKVKGTLVMDKLLAGQTLDFVLYFSSTGNIFPRLKFGQVAYNAGHEFIDVYAQAKRKNGENAFVINFNDWQGVGIAAEAAQNHSYSLKNHDVTFDELLSIKPKEGLYAMSAILESNHPLIAISAYDVDELQDFINSIDFSEVVVDGSDNQNNTGQTREDLSTEYIKPTTSIQKQLASVFKEIFRIEDVGIDDDFFELGGDSIKAISAISSMQQKHSLDIPITTFFEKRTIRNMAEFLGEDLSTESGMESDPDDVKVIEDEEFYQPFPISPIQMAYFMGRSDQFDMGGISTNVYQESEIAVDLDALNLSFNKILNRHPMLKIFFLEDGQQQFHRVDHYEIKNTDLRDLDKKAQSEFLEKERNRLNNFLFDEKQWPLFEISTCTLADGKHYLFFCFDHLICDAASLMILVKEWGKLIKDIEAPLPKLEYTYRDYIIDFQKQRNSDKFEKSKKYWLDRLESFPSAPAIPTKVDASEIKKPKFNRQRKVFSKSDWNKLKAIAKKNNCTPSVVLCASYARVLSFWSNSNDLAINLTLFNRYPFHDDVQRVVGDFTMLVLLGANLDSSGDFMDDVKNVQRTLLEALDNRFYDGIDFIRELRKSRQLGTSAVMPFVFTSALFDSDLTATEDDEVLGIWGQQRDSGQAVSQTSQVYIDCTSAELNEGLELVWDYVEELFDQEIIETMFSQFVTLINNFINQDNEIVFKIPENHIRLIDQEVNATDQEFPDHLTVIDIFEKQVEKTPDNVALSLKGEKLTFEELNKKANQLARTLVAQGVVPETPVAILADRSFEMMIGIYAIMKAGGVYLPLAPSNPDERIDYMVMDAGVNVALVQSDLFDKLPKKVKSIILDNQGNFSASDKNLKVSVEPTHAAYIIYTSGSTGQPKGVIVEHRSLVNRLHWMQRSYPLSSADHLVQKTPISFDVSIWELFWWVFEGASLSLLPVNDEKSPEKLVESIENDRISTIHFVPSMFDLFLNHIIETNSADRVLQLKRIFCSGEELLSTHVEKFNQVFENGNCQLINLYGPTEATIDVSYYNCTRKVLDNIPIGMPIDNIKLYVLNDTFQAVPVGVSGQLFISGVGVARGYVNNEELTKEKFLKDPFIQGQTMYATGDRVKQLPNGDLIYLGRFDNQVKLKGNRIELGEVENSLAKIKGVDMAAVAVKTDNHDHKYLCAYLIAKEEISTKVLRQQLAEWLPEYMIPSHFLFLESIPLTSNGKVNRRLLPDPGKTKEDSSDYQAPNSDLEHQLAGIYAELLNIEDPSINASFFDLGGDSFKATFLITSIQKNIGKKVSLGQVFKTPSITELAGCLESNGKTFDSSFYDPIQKIETQDYYQLSGVQKRLFAQQGQGSETVTLNIFMNQRLKGALDHEKFARAFRAVIDRHEILRTTFELQEGEVYQRVHDSDQWTFALPYEDLTSSAQIDRLTEEKTNELAYHPFDLLKGQMYKVKLLKVGKDEHIILFAIHHIIFDLWSQEVFIGELFHFYNSFITNSEPTLPDLRIQYKDYSQWHNKTLSSEQMNHHKQYWTDQLAGNLPVLQLPTDRPRPSKQTFVGDEVYYEIPSEMIPGIKEYMAKHDATLFMVLMAAIKGLLLKYTGQNDIIVGTPIADREHPDLKDQLGCYINTIPIRDNIKSSEGFDEIIQRVKTSTLDGYEHQACPFDWMTETLGQPTDPSRSPLFDVSLVVSQNFDFEKFQNDAEHNIEVTPIRKNLKISKTDLIFQFLDNGKNIQGTIQYNADLFNHSRIERMSEHLLILTKTMLENPEIPISQVNYLTEEESELEKQTVDSFSSSIDTNF